MTNKLIRTIIFFYLKHPKKKLNKKYSKDLNYLRLPVRVVLISRVPSLLTN